MSKNVMKMVQSGAPRATAALVAVGAGATAYSCFYTLKAGERAVVFSRLTGLSQHIREDGTHFKKPWFDTPYIFNVQKRKTDFQSETGTKDLQMVHLTLTTLYQPNIAALPKILSETGPDYAEKILPSIVRETLASVVAQFNASQLITQRDQVSRLINRNLTERAKAFHIELDDVTITHLTFGKEYAKAVEDKQIAQQDAERAKYLVIQALEEKKSKVIAAEAMAEASKTIGSAVAKNPAYIQLRQLENAQKIASIIGRSNNKVYLDSDSLLLNVLQEGESAKRLAD